tara:strand:- start:347 stop:604 length:258 start_codon:yes stop_codon:yes gene_type:complete
LLFFVVYLRVGIRRNKMPTLRDWEDYIELEEELNLEEARKKVHQKQTTDGKKGWDNSEIKSNKKGHKNNVKRDKKNSWCNHPTRI